MISLDSIGHLDRCRRPTPARNHRQPGPGTKEWHHIVVHSTGLSLLVNLSESASATKAPVTRCIVMAHTDQWHNGVSTSHPRSVHIRTDVLDATYGDRTRLWWERDHYRLVVDDPALPCQIDMRLDPIARPAMLTGVTLSTTERLSWFFVPRLHATGQVTIGNESHHVDQALAYHDHNWGHFDWGGGYSWEWLSGITPDWSVTASRLLDGRQSRLTSQYMHVESNGFCETFRDAEISCRHEGRRRDDDVPVVPGVMRLITPTLVEDVPERMYWDARRGTNHVEVTLTTEKIVRLAIPSERHVDEVVVLAEVLGTVEVNGVINHVEICGQGQALLELLR